MDLAFRHKLPGFPQSAPEPQPCPIPPTAAQETRPEHPRRQGALLHERPQARPPRQALFAPSRGRPRGLLVARRRHPRRLRPRTRSRLAQVEAIAVAMWREIRADRVETEVMAGNVPGMKGHSHGTDLYGREERASLTTALRYRTQAQMELKRATDLFWRHRKARLAELLEPAVEVDEEVSLPAGEAAALCTNEFPAEPAPPPSAPEPAPAAAAEAARTNSSRHPPRPRPPRTNEFPTTDKKEEEPDPEDLSLLADYRALKKDIGDAGLDLAAGSAARADGAAPGFGRQRAGARARGAVGGQGASRRPARRPSTGKPASGMLRSVRRSVAAAAAAPGPIRIRRHARFARLFASGARHRRAAGPAMTGDGQDALTLVPGHLHLGTLGTLARRTTAAPAARSGLRARHRGRCRHGREGRGRQGARLWGQHRLRQARPRAHRAGPDRGAAAPPRPLAHVRRRARRSTTPRSASSCC